MGFVVISWEMIYFSKISKRIQLNVANIDNAIAPSKSIF